MKVFFDLDPAVYMSAFAAQKTKHSVVWEDERGDMREDFFTDGKECGQFVKALPDNGGLLIERFAEVEAQDEAFACQCAKYTIEGALKEIKRKFKTDLEPYFFLTGEGNFRDEIATIAKYKGNRDKMMKPVHYQVVRDYFIDQYGAYVIDGMEADDEVSIRAWHEWRNSVDEYVVATIDKDLDQIPGWHYDYKKHVFYEVDELDGELFFYAQVLSGDATDNIKGCYRIGLKKAEKLVAEWFDAFDHEDESYAGGWRADVWAHIIDVYLENMKQYPDKHEHGLKDYEAALENARLVYMLKERGEMWSPS